MKQRYVCEEYAEPEIEGYKIICDIETHDIRIREEVIEEFYNRFNRYKSDMNTSNYPWNYVEEVYRQMRKEQK